MGCGHFRKSNEWLTARGEAGIDWLENRSPKAAQP